MSEGMSCLREFHEPSSVHHSVKWDDSLGGPLQVHFLKDKNKSDGTGSGVEVTPSSSPAPAGVPTNPVAFLIPFFVNFTYYICLGPFRIRLVLEDPTVHSLYIHQNVFQKIVCGILCGLGTFVCCLVTYSQIAGKNIENNPLVIFHFWSYTVFCAWCFIFVHLTWRKQGTLLALVKQSPLPESYKTSWLMRVGAAAFSLSLILLEMFHKTVFYLFREKYDLVRGAESYSGLALHSLFMRGSTDPIPWAELTPLTLTLSTLHFIGWQLFGVIKSLVYIHVTFLCLFLRGEMSRALAILNLKPTQPKSWELYVGARKTLELINELIGGPVLGIFLVLVPFLASTSIQRWDSQFIEYKLLILLQFTWPMIALICAAEAGRKGSELLARVKQLTPITDKWGRVESRYFLLDNVRFGVRGGKFFNVSYSFLGTTLSIILTYAIVILQFLYEPPPPGENCRANSDSQLM